MPWGPREPEIWDHMPYTLIIPVVVHEPQTLVGYMWSLSSNVNSCVSKARRPPRSVAFGAWKALSSQSWPSHKRLLWGNHASVPEVSWALIEYVGMRRQVPLSTFCWAVFLKARGGHPFSAVPYLAVCMKIF